MTSEAADPIPDWPQGLTVYRRTAEFDETSLPQALRRAHTTKPGTWGALNVLSGSLLFRDEPTGSEVVLGPGIHRVIHPRRPHAVAPVGAVRVFIEFLNLP